MSQIQMTCATLWGSKLSLRMRGPHPSSTLETASPYIPGVEVEIVHDDHGIRIGPVETSATELPPSRLTHAEEFRDLNERDGHTLGHSPVVLTSPGPSCPILYHGPYLREQMSRNRVGRYGTSRTPLPRWGLRVRIPSSARRRARKGPRSCPGRLAFAPATRVIRRGGRVVRQGSAKPSTPVQFRSPPRLGGTMPNFGRLAQG